MRTRTLLLALTLLVMTSASKATVVTLIELGNNFVSFDFAIGPQPAAHNALSIGLFSSTGPTTGVAGTTSLFDGTSLLVQHASVFVGTRYATAGSGFSAIVPIIPDYAPIANGTINGRWTFLLTSGSRTFDTDDFFVTAFGDGGSAPGAAGQLGTVEVSRVTAATPAPGTALLLALALLGIVLRRRP
jgi:hypothetical protein